MAGRHSKRVRHEEPDVDTNDYECFVCHLKSQTCDRRVQLPCCKQYAHRRCQLRWEEHHKTCGLCRAPLNGCNDVTPVSAQNNHSDNDENAELARQEIIRNRPNVDTDRIARDVLNMTREEVITRLRTLIDSPTLEEQLERVRDLIPHFSSFLVRSAVQNMDDLDVYIRTFILVQRLNSE